MGAYNPAIFWHQIKNSNTVKQEHEEFCFLPESTEGLNLEQPKRLVKGIWEPAASGCLWEADTLS